MACAMLLLNSCSKKEDEDNTKPVPPLENTVWYREQIEKKSGSDWTIQTKEPDWMVFGKKKVTTRSSTKVYVLNMQNRTVVIDGNEYFINEYSNTQLVWEKTDHTERITFRKIDPITFSDLQGSWGYQGSKKFDKKTNDWGETLSVGNFVFRFDSESSGIFIKGGQGIAFNFGMNGNILKINFWGVGTCFVTKLTSDEMILINIHNTEIRQDTFKRFNN